MTKTTPPADLNWVKGQVHAYAFQFSRFPDNLSLHREFQKFAAALAKGERYPSEKR